MKVIVTMESDATTVDDPLRPWKGLVQMEGHDLPFYSVTGRDFVECASYIWRSLAEMRFSG